MSFNERYAKEEKEKDHYQYIKHRKGKWVIIQKGTGKELSHHDTREDAISAFKAMMANKYGSVDQTIAGKIKQMLGVEWPDGTAINRVKFKNPSQCTECGTDFWDAKHPSNKSNFSIMNEATYWNQMNNQKAERSANDDSICKDCALKGE
jgi:hypothetical protein